jgi:hypothetical protein
MRELSTRRGLITGLGALFLAAPAIVRASSLMPVSATNIDSKLQPFDWTIVDEAGQELRRWVLKAQYRIIEETGLPHVATWYERVGG